jgi:hypothetical protein
VAEEIGSLRRYLLIVFLSPGPLNDAALAGMHNVYIARCSARDMLTARRIHSATLPNLFRSNSAEAAPCAALFEASSPDGKQALAKVLERPSDSPPCEMLSPSVHEGQQPPAACVP